MKTLSMPLRQPHFDDIKNGKKVIEYREVKQHWTIRLFNRDGSIKPYDGVEFINGYNPDSLRMIVEFKGFSIKRGRYEIALGKVLKVYRKQPLRKKSTLLSKDLDKYFKSKV